MAASLPHVVEQFGALHHDALPGVDARRNQHAFAIERLDVHRALLEPLGSDVDVNHVLPIGASHQAARGIAMPRFSSPVFTNTVTNCPGAQPVGRRR